MKNILSIDLESWVHTFIFNIQFKRGNYISANRKKLDNSYILNSTREILNLLDKYKQRATFFIVGEIYEWYPNLVDEILQKGHEIGYHTHTHVIIKNRKVLENELEKSANFIATFHPKIFRAPNIYITTDSLSLLKQWGFAYSSSTYGEFKVREIEGIEEIPVSSICYWGTKKNSLHLPRNLTMKILCQEIPFGSGLFIGLLGSKISYFINKLNEKNVPAVLFFHPWQLDFPVDINSLSFKLKTLFCYPLFYPYTINIKDSFAKVIQEYEFTSFRDFFYPNYTRPMRITRLTRRQP